VASATKIESELGWIPEHSLERIALDAWEFLQNQGEK